jgi:hypothetical protein
MAASLFSNPSLRGVGFGAQAVPLPVLLAWYDVISFKNSEDLYEQHQRLCIKTRVQI